MFSKEVLSLNPWMTITEEDPKIGVSYVCTIYMKSKKTTGGHNGIIDRGMLPGQAFGADVSDLFVGPSLTGNAYILS